MFGSPDTHAEVQGQGGNMSFARGPGPRKYTLSECLETIYGVLFQPRVAMKKLAVEPPLFLAIVLYVFVDVFSGFASYTAWSDLLPSGILSFLSPYFFIVGVAVQLLVWFGVTAVFHLIAEFVGGRGSGVTLLTLIGLAQLPRLLYPPLALILNPISPLIAGLASFAFNIWIVILYVLAVSSVYGLSTARAVLVVFLPVICLIVLAIILVVMVGLIAAGTTVT